MSKLRQSARRKAVKNSSARAAARSVCGCATTPYLYRTDMADYIDHVLSGRGLTWDDLHSRTYDPDVYPVITMLCELGLARPNASAGS